VDPALHQSLSWALENSVEGVLFETFAVQDQDGEGQDGDEKEGNDAGGLADGDADGLAGGEVGGEAGGAGCKAAVQTGSENPGGEKPGGGSGLGDGNLVDLIPGGRGVAVTDSNKGEYVSLRAAWRLTFSVEEELAALRKGLADVVAPDLLKAFDESELDRLLTGLPEVDVDHLRAYVSFQGGLEHDSARVLWLFEYWRALPAASKGKLLSFVTGADRVPLDGCLYIHSTYARKYARKYAYLSVYLSILFFCPEQCCPPPRLRPRFDPPLCLVHGGSDPAPLPHAHTCFNQLVLPGYPTYDVLAHKFDTLLDHCDGTFALA